MSGSSSADLPVPAPRSIADGCVRVPERPGLGDDIGFDYFREQSNGKGKTSVGAPEVY